MAQRFTIGDGNIYTMVEPDRVTFAEADAVERITGHTFKAIQEDDELTNSVRVVQAMLMVSIKRFNPTFTMNDLNDVAIGDLDWLDDDEPQPAEESADPTLPLDGVDVDSQT